MHPDMVLVVNRAVPGIDFSHGKQGRAMSNRIRTRTLGWVSAAWSAVVASVLVWQTVRYNGVVGWLAEWQFRTFDRFFPVATIVILTAILTLPFVILITVRLRKAGKQGQVHSQSELLARTGIAATFLTVGIVTSAALAVALFFAGMAQGRIAEKPVAVNLNKLANSDGKGAVPEGPVKVKGTVLWDRAGFYREGFIFTSRELWAAPIVTGKDTSKLNVFIEVSRPKDSTPRSGEIEGYLKSEGVPGGLAQLYINSGYSVNSKPHLIYRDLRSARWPYWSAAGDFAILLMLLTVAALFHNRFRKKLAAQKA